MSTSREHFLYYTSDKKPDPEGMTCNWPFTDRQDPRKSQTTLFCTGAYNHFIEEVLAHGTMILFLSFTAYLIVRLHKKRNLFPIRERAPRVATLQSLTYWVLILLLYVIEICTRYGIVDWYSPEYCQSPPTSADPPNATTSLATPYIPVWRRILKATYLTIRINIYFIFLLR